MDRKTLGRGGPRVHDLRHTFDWYKAFVVAGAEEHGLPAGYIADLRAVESKPDPDKERREKQGAILSRASRKPA